MKHQTTTRGQAKTLRKVMTKQEKVLWSIFRNRNFFGLKFRRQVPIGNYVADFVCESENIIIELDGGQHNIPANIESDVMRTQFLNSKGYQVYRFWNNDIDKNIGGVYLELKRIFRIKD